MKKILLLAATLLMGVCSWAQSSSEYFEYVKLGAGKYYAADNVNNVFFGNHVESYQFYGTYTNPTADNIKKVNSFSFAKAEGDYYSITDNKLGVPVAFDNTKTQMPSNHATQTVRPLTGEAASDAKYQGNTNWIIKTKGNGFTIGPSLNDANVNWNKHGQYLGMWGSYNDATVITLVPADLESLNDLLAQVKATEGCKDTNSLKGGEKYSEEASQYYGQVAYETYDFAAAKSLASAYFAGKNADDVYGNEVVTSITASTVEKPVAYYVHCARQNQSYYWNSIGGPTNVASEIAEVAFVAVDDVADAYYIYNITAGKFMSYNDVNNGKGKTTNVDNVNDAKYWNIVYKTSNGGFFEIRPYSNGSVANTYMNWHGGLPYGNNSMGFYSSNGDQDKGSSWTIIKKYVNEEGTDPEPEKTTLSVTLLNGSEEISLSDKSATSVATATGIKFAFANVSNESVGYAYAIYQGEEEEPIYAGGAEYSIDSDDFEQTIHFAKDEQYKVVVSCLFDGPDFTYTITGTYEEEGDPTGETIFDTKKQYTLHATASQRGYLAYNPAETSKVGLADVTLNGYQTKHPASTADGVGINWKFETTTSSDEVVLFNTTCSKYLGKNGDIAVWVETKDNAQVLSVEKKSEGVYTFKAGNAYLVAACGYEENQGAVRFQTKYENASDFTVAEVDTESAASEEAVNAAIELLYMTGAGYPTADAAARTALENLLDQTEISKSDLASAVAAYKASTDIEMPKAGTSYYVEAQFVDGTSAVMTAKEGVLTFTKEESEKEASYVTIVSAEGNNVVMTIGSQFVHVTCGSDDSGKQKEADYDGLSETQDATTTLTLTAGGAAQFGRFTIQGKTSSNATYFLTTRDDLNGTFAFVAANSADKFYDDNYNHNGHNRTSYFTFTEKLGDTTGISAVAPVVAGKAIYNLQGQRIQKLQKGINIVGGQKVVR